MKTSKSGKSVSFLFCSLFTTLLFLVLCCTAASKALTVLLQWKIVLKVTGELNLLTILFCILELASETPPMTWHVLGLVYTRRHIRDKIFVEIFSNSTQSSVSLQYLPLSSWLLCATSHIENSDLTFKISLIVDMVVNLDGRSLQYPCFWLLRFDALCFLGNISSYVFFSC